MHPVSDGYATDAIFMARSAWSEKEAIKIGRVRAPPGRGLRVPKRWLAVPNRGVLPDTRAHYGQVANRSSQKGCGGNAQRTNLQLRLRWFLCKKLKAVPERVPNIVDKLSDQTQHARHFVLGDVAELSSDDVRRFRLREDIDILPHHCSLEAPISVAEMRRDVVPQRSGCCSTKQFCEERERRIRQQLPKLSWSPYPLLFCNRCNRHWRVYPVACHWKAPTKGEARHLKEHVRSFMPEEVTRSIDCFDVVQSPDFHACGTKDGEFK